VYLRSGDFVPSHLKKTLEFSNKEIRDNILDDLISTKAREFESFDREKL
jgi:hypothetical protein